MIEARGQKTSEKERVPPVSRQFESLSLSPAEQSGGVAEQEEDTGRAQNVGKFEMQGKEEDADIAQYRQAAQQSCIDALRAAEERYNKAKEVSCEKTAQAKDGLKQGAEKTSEYGAEKGGEAKDTLAGSGKTGWDYTGQAKDYVAVGGKDYVGSVATSVKDKGFVGGWGAGEYTAEKAAAVANVSAAAAGYVGDTAVAAKDKVGSVGVSSKDYAAHKLAAAKDSVVATQQSAKDYAARNRAEAKQSAEARVIFL